jgi:predicted signal transduction protein with EAL and GGDEF domain
LEQILLSSNRNGVIEGCCAHVMSPNGWWVLIGAPLVLVPVGAIRILTVVRSRRVNSEEAAAEIAGLQ